MVSDGLNPSSPCQLADIIRDFVNDPSNTLRGANKNAMLAAAERIENLTVNQLQDMLGQQVGRTGKTLEDLLLSNNPREQAAAVLGVIRSAGDNSGTQMRQQPQQSAPQQSQPQQSQPQQSQPRQSQPQQSAPQQSQPQPAQPQPGRSANPIQDFMNALEQGNARNAGAALKALADQQLEAARRSGNAALAETANINRKAAEALSGPNGQRKLESTLNTALAGGKKVSDMLTSTNPNTRNLVAALVANQAAPGAERYARNNLQGLQLAAQMESLVNGGMTMDMTTGRLNINGGHSATTPEGPAPTNGGRTNPNQNQR